MARGYYLYPAIGIPIVLLSGYYLIARANAPAGKLVASRPEISWHARSSDAEKTGLKAQVQFPFTNTGGRPVRITKVRTTCGCTKAEARPEVVPPGASGIVEAHGDPLPAGVRTVTITVECDSPETPEMALHLRMVGARKPPFLIRAFGDLAYLGSFSEPQPRQVVVIMVENREGIGPPKVSSDAPYFKVDPPSVKEEAYGEEGYESGTMLRTYTYPIRLDPAPDGDRFSAYISVASPGDGAILQTLLAQGSRVVPLKAVPAWISLKPDASARFLITSRNPAPDMVVAAESGAESPLLIEAAEGGSDRVRSFTVRVDPARRSSAAGVHRLIARRSP